MTNPPDDLETERRIRAAFKARSNRVVTSRPWPSEVAARREGLARGGVRLALVAAVLFAVVGIGVVAWPDSGESTSDVATATPPTSAAESDDGDDVDSQPEPTTSASEAEPTPDESDGADGLPGPSGLPSTYGRVSFAEQAGVWSVEPVPSSLRLLDDGHYFPPGAAPPSSDPVPGPLRQDSAEEAARRWLSAELGIDDPQWLDVGYKSPEDHPASLDVPLGVARLGEGGRAIGLGMMVGTAARSADDWYVTQVVSDEVWIDTVERNGDDGHVTLRISGGGRAFEGTALLRVGDADPVVVSVGAGVDSGRFSVVVPWRETGDVEVMIVAPAVAEGATPAATAIVASPTSPSTWLSVVGVADDDVLNVRSGPGTANEVVTTLDPDATGVTHTGATTQVDGELWWEIVTPPPAGETGWVNRRFIAVAPAVGPDSALAQEMFALAGAALRDFGPDAVGLSLASRYSERIKVGGIGVWADASHAFQTRDPLQLESDVFWEPPFEMNECVECTKSVREFVGVRDRDLAEAILTVGPGVEFDDNWSFTHGLSSDFYSRYATVVAYTPASDPQETLDWSRYTFIFDFVDGAPEIRGIHRWGWTP